MLFRANFKDPDDNKVYRVIVIAVDLQIEKALVHRDNALVIVDIHSLIWSGYD